MFETGFSHQLFRFLCVGSVGFVVDGGLLFLLVWLGVDPYVARVFSFPIAVIATWRLNRLWTFADADRARPARQLNRYFAVQIIGALCNYAIYSGIVAANGETLMSVAVGFAIGSAVGMFVNFLGARALVFKSKPDLDQSTTL